MLSLASHLLNRNDGASSGDGGVRILSKVGAVGREFMGVAQVLRVLQPDHWEGRMFNGSWYVGAGANCRA